MKSAVSHFVFVGPPNSAWPQFLEYLLIVKMAIVSVAHMEYTRTLKVSDPAGTQ